MRPLALCLVLAVTAAPALHAQARPIPPGTYQDQVQRATAGPILNAAQAAAANQLLDQVLPVLRATPGVTTAPPDQCVRMSSHAYASDGRPALKLSLSLLLVTEGNCYGLTKTVVELTINDDTGPLKKASLPGPAEAHYDALAIFNPLESRPSPGEYSRYGDYVVLSRPGASPYLPVPRETYLRALQRGWEAGSAEGERGMAKHEREVHEALRDWLNGGRARQIADNERMLKEVAAYMSAEQVATMRTNMEKSIEQTEQMLRFQVALIDSMAPQRDAGRASVRRELERVNAELERLTPEQRKLPACLDPGNPWGTAGPLDCPADRQFVMRNPDYWNRALPPGTPQLIVVRIGEFELIRGNTQSPQARNAAAQHALARSVVDALDYAALARLVR